VKRKLGHHILLLIPGIILYMLPYIAFERGTDIIRILHRIDIIYILIVVMMIGNSILLAFLDIYSTTDKNRRHPLHGLIQGLQVILYFVGAIIILAVAINKSPAVLLTGLGASAAVLMLVFKDSILGFVAGVQLSQNNMIRLGDWIQMPDGSANGNVEEITLNTVKVRNWDNTLTMIPPYTLVTTPFKNWRGMQESGGRRADKNIYIDINTLEICTPDMISDIRKAVPLMDSFIKSMPPEGESKLTTDVQMYRLYI
jgi:small-conductance mechanosensitive channel